jgi:hypothetical protein
MAKPALTIDLSGPLFTRDPGKTVRQNMRRAIEGLVEEGEHTVQSLWPVRTGRGRAGSRGRVTSLSGKPWFLTGVVSATYVYPWPGGGSKQYRGGKVEAKHGMFRKTAAAMRRSRKVIAADLTRGLN